MSGHIAEWVGGLGPGIANHLWQSTAFVAAAWLVTLGLRQNQARVRYAVWLAASAKFLIPFSLLIAMGNLLPHPRQAVAPVVYSAMDVVEEPFAEIPQYVPPAVHVVTMRERVEAVLPAGMFVLWLLGAGVVVFRWVRGWRVVQRTLRRAEVACEGREWEILRRVEAESRPSGAWMDLPIELRLSAERMEPGIFGVGRPVLVWPRELSARLDDEHIEAIVAHELAHVRRRDNLTAALHMVVETVFWFHPAVWWMERQMVKEREQACDEAVVEKGGNAETYAESLLKTCRFCIESPLVCVAGVTGADLKQRVVGIVTGRALLRMSWAKKALISAAAVCIVVAPVVLGQAKAAQRLMLAAFESAPKPVQAVITEVVRASDADVADASQGAASASTPSTPDIAFTAKPFDLDAVSIRPSDPNVRGPVVFGPQPDGFIALNMPLNTMLSLFYGPELQMDVNRIDGGPDWVRTSSWIIRAKIAQAEVDEWGKLVRDQSPAARSVRNATIQAMLESRFKLKMHFETREGTVYALVVAKGGLKMQESTPDERGEISAHGSRFTFQKASMSTILTSIAQQVGSPVIDKTGLTGNYDFTLDSTPLRGAPPPSTDASASLDAPPSIFNAVEEQLGLKLVAQKGPVTHLVIDHAERPSVDGAEVNSGDEGQLSAAYRKWLDEDVHWLVMQQERTEFLKLATDRDRDAFIEAFWEKRNAPGAAKGAYKQEGYARIAYANDNFAAGGKPGWATDRGRAIIQFGKPDSIAVDNNELQTWIYRILPGMRNGASLRFVRVGNDYQLSGAWPQESAAYVPTMTFEVASVREAKYDPTGTRVSGGFTPINSSNLKLENFNFLNLITFAYPIRYNMIDGLPKELGWKLFMVEAKADTAADEQLAKLPKDEVDLEQRHMMQVLLVERFHLKVHWETREGDTYDLVVSKAGKLRTTGDAPSAQMVKAFGDRPIPPVLQQGGSDRGFEYFGYGATTGDLASLLSGQFGRPVNDKTGLTDKYYFHLKTWQVRASDRKDDETNPWPPLESALQDELGLKLVPSHGPVRYLVVDHIEMPTEN